MSIMRLLKSRIPIAATMLFLIVLVAMSTSQSGASETDQELLTLAVLDTVDLEAENDELKAQVEELEARLEESEFDSKRKGERILRGIEWRMNVYQDLWSTRRELRRVREEGTDLAALDIEWIRAYVNGGGSHLDEMFEVILPCESGGARVPPHEAISPSHDYGRAQLNRKVWKQQFETMFSTDFETGSLDPTLNGAFAAHIENVQGLTAWVCWNKR